MALPHLRHHGKGRSPLRRRLVAGLVLLAALGMAISGLVLTRQLSSYLVDRVDRQLADVVGPGGPPPGFTGNGNGGFPSPSEGRFRRADLYVGAATSTGAQLTPLTRAHANGKELPTPTIDAATLQKKASPYGVPAEVFTVGTSGSTRYRAVATHDDDGNIVLYAISLADADNTVSQLVLIEVLVFGSVLIAIAVLGLWAVRLGLRPLERMAADASKVAEAAEGDGAWQRLEPSDDSEVGRLGQALNTMLGRLERAFASQRASEERLRRFLSDASHELRTPLTSIRGYAELFRRGAAERPDDLAMAMSRIEAEAARMGVLVEDLLVLARLDEQRPLDLTEVDLATVVQESVTDARAAQPDRSWTLTAPDSVPITGAEAQLRQVVANLLSNVRAHTPVDAACEVALADADPDGLVRLTVTDHGPGVSPELAGRIFERFTTSDESRTRTHQQTEGGTGLGLSIVASIVDAHGGSVAIDSPPGGGVTITVTLPEAGPGTTRSQVTHRPAPAPPKEQLPG